jgi:DNA modification methylase
LSGETATTWIPKSPFCDALFLKPGGSLYDPFLGSATALIAAERTGTSCHAMEIDPIYVEVALRRWERFSGAEAERIDG